MNRELPAWNNKTEYQAIESADYLKDLELAKKCVLEIQMLSQELRPWFEGAALDGHHEQVILNLQKISKFSLDANTLIGNLNVYVQCELSVDSQNAQALKARSTLQKISTERTTSLKAFDVFLTKSDDLVFEAYLASPLTKDERFLWSEKRKMKDHLLSTPEEMTITQFRQYGLQGWSNLYDQISGALKVEIASEQKTVGLAEASGYLRSSDENLRRETWQGIQKSWKLYQDPCAATLNNLAGFRLEEYKKRSQKKAVHFLDFPLMQARIESATLNAMMEAVHAQIQTPRRSLQAMAKLMKKPRLDPWDLLAPPPAHLQSREYSFAEAVDLIAKSFDRVTSEMGDFARMMAKNEWLEARILPNKASGAHCTGFIKSRTPRVFQTFNGSFKDVSTLAHELGHAYHSWVMRDLPIALVSYPMTLAETASIFAENVLADYISDFGSQADQFAIAWEDASHAASLLVNIPARFDFEKSFYEAREKGFVSPGELSAMTDKAWRKWYGDELSQTEEQYWMSKLHFSIAGVSFYNFPYTFGYLFSLGIYAKRQQLGDQFSKSYVEILRDTGRMTAEDLIQKHLGEDIRKPQFWLSSLEIVNQKVSKFEKLALGYQ